MVSCDNNFLGLRKNFFPDHISKAAFFRPNFKWANIIKILGIIMDSQRILNKNLHTLADGTKRRLAPLDKRMIAMGKTLMKLVKQQEKTRRLLMTIIFTGIVPLLAFITALAGFNCLKFPDSSK